MSLTQFITLIRRHLLVLFLVPLIMGVIVIFLTAGTPKTYHSETLIYTGIASGYNIESGSNSRVDYFATNNAFDNLLQIINGRETREEIGIRLLAQHLALDSADIKIISQLHLDELRTFITDSLRKELLRYKKASLKNTQPQINGGEAAQKILLKTKKLYL